MREWMRRNSTIWGRLDPFDAPPAAAPVTYPCAGCGKQLHAPATHHRIGTHWEGKAVYARFCDGVLEQQTA